MWFKSTAGLHFMIITPLSINPVSLRLGDSGSARAEGLHASTIYNSLYMELEPDRYKGGPMNPLLLETGIIIENMLEEGLRRRFNQSTGCEQIERPGEFVHTDVWEGHPVFLSYNPDLFIYNGVGLRVGEIKGTWLSSHIRHDWIVSPESIMQYADDIQEAIASNPKLDKYWCQLQFYMHMIRTRYGRLYACFIAGDYTRPFKSQLVAVDVEFSEDELTTNYARCMNHALLRKLI